MSRIKPIEWKTNRRLGFSLWQQQQWLETGDILGPAANLQFDYNHFEASSSSSALISTFALLMGENDVNGKLYLPLQSILSFIKMLC